MNNDFTVFDYWFFTMSLDEVYGWESYIGDWFFTVSIAFLVFELVRYGFKKQISRALVGDTVANFVTLAMYIAFSYGLLGAFYLSAYAYFQEYAVLDIEINWVSISICVLLADLAYYWEHRFTHRVNVAWATHAVHHSSPHFNISVAYRFGPLDGLWPVFFHLPLVILGFNPVVVFFAEMFVQLFQTMLHTEAIRKLPKPLEAIFNTPSHHRVHHGSNEKYLDTNYGGIFIIWDRWFGTFANEEERVVYGLTEPVTTINPLKIWFCGFLQLVRDQKKISGLKNKMLLWVSPPGWYPSETSAQDG
ncbi:MAG: sterol desaturase family protein [Pseudomonadota bacterium]